MIDVSAGYYRCDCVKGFVGWRCEVDTDECASKPCITADFNVTCHDMQGRFTCGDVPTLDLTLNINISNIPPGSLRRREFMDSFRKDMAKTLGMPADRIVVTNIFTNDWTKRRQLDSGPYNESGRPELGVYKDNEHEEREGSNYEDNGYENQYEGIDEPYRGSRKGSLDGVAHIPPIQSRKDHDELEHAEYER